MKTLKTIQTTCNVFRIIAKVAMILSFVQEGLALAGIGCAAVLKNGAEQLKELGIHTACPPKIII